MIPTLLTDSVTYDLERAVHYTLLWGLEGLELRSVGGVHDRVPNVNEHQLKMRLMESDLSVTAINPGVFVGSTEDRAAWMNELAGLDETFEFCKRIGCERIVVSSFMGGGDAAFEDVAGVLSRAGRQAERHGMTLCVLNEIDYVASTGRGLQRLLEAVDISAVRIAWDPAAALMSGEDPVEGLEAVVDRIEMVRCRSAARIGNGYEPRPIDEGDVDWTGQIRRLAAAGFGGPVSLDIDVEPLAKQGLHEATCLIQLLRSTALR